MRKSFMSALYGQAVARGQIDLDRTIGDIGIEDEPTLTDQEKSATVRDLLQARSGVYLPAPPPPAGARAGPSPRPARGAYAPGTHWCYNNWDFNVLGNIYERLTKKGVFTALEHDIARPIGMQDFDVFRDGAYEYVRDDLGGDLRYPNYRMALTARDIARFGQVFLRGGRWNDVQVIPADWVKLSTTAVSTVGGSPARNAYGYLWWIAQPGESEGPIPRGSYSAAGAGGNFLTVMPDLDTVVVALVDSQSRDFRPLAGPDYDAILSAVVAGHPTHHSSS
jgi:CubicO group peptidase (beta-lactamase class C family)